MGIDARHDPHRQRKLLRDMAEGVTLYRRHFKCTKQIVDVPFERPRNVLELRARPAYGELVYSIWGQLRDEVQSARMQDEKEFKA